MDQSFPEPEEHLRPDSTQEEPEEADYSLSEEGSLVQPGKMANYAIGKLNFRHETIAHMLASGMNQTTIANDLGYTNAHMSRIVNTPEVQARAKEIQQKYWGENIEQRFKQALPKAMDNIEEVLHNELNLYKPQQVLDTSKWLIEKRTGKAPQRVDIESQTLTDLYEKLDQVQVSGQTIDVSPVQEEENSTKDTEGTKETQQDTRDTWNRWIDDNLDN